MAEGNRLSSVTEFQQALEESENRRKILLQTIKDTQENIRLQSLRLDEGEQLAKERQKELDKVKDKERNYQRYITNLESQLLIGKQRQEAQLKILQDAENKFELLQEEASALRSSVVRLQGECKHKEDKLKCSSSRLQELEEENASLVAELESANQKLLTQHESLSRLREDNAFLDKQAKSEAMDAERLRKENALLCAEMKQLRKQVASLNEKSSIYMKESSLLTSQLQASSVEEKRLKGQLAELQRINSEMKEIISRFASERDRFFREKLEHHVLIQNLTVEKDTLFRERLLADDQANELSSELARVKLLANKLAEENKHLSGELNEIRKIRDSPSCEAFNARYKSDQQKDQIQSFEQRKLIAFQQHDLYKDEIRSLEQQLLDCQKMLKAANKEKDSAVSARGQLTAELQNEVRQLREEKLDLELKLEIQKDISEAGKRTAKDISEAGKRTAKDISEAGKRKQMQECVCKCHDGNREKGDEDIHDGMSRKERSKDISEEFEAHPGQENTSAHHFAAFHSTYADFSQINKQLIKKLSSDQEEIQANKPPVTDIFSETLYVENKKSLNMSNHWTPKYSEQHLASQFETSEIEPKGMVPADDLGLGLTDMYENITRLADVKTGENAAVTDLPDVSGSRKDTKLMRDEESTDMVWHIKANSFSNKREELSYVDSLEKDDHKDDQKEGVTLNASGTQAVKQEDAIKLQEDNCKMEIYVCVADDQDEKFFEEGAAAFLVLLPPNSNNVSVINDRSVDGEHQENAVANKSVTDDKDESNPQTNIANNKKIVENRARTSDVQIYHLASDDSKVFRNCFAGQNISAELISPGIPLFGTSACTMNSSPAGASETIQPRQAVQDTETGPTVKNNEVNFADICDVIVTSDSRNIQNNESC